MVNNRIWVISGVLIVIVVLALGGLLGVKPQLDAAQASNDDRASTEALNAQHKAEIAVLKEQSARLPEFQAAVADLRRSVPALPDFESFTGELAALQASTGVQITSFTPQAAALFAPSAATSALVPAVVGGSSFVKVDIDLSAKGTRDQALAFVKGLQSGSRLVLVSDLTISAEESGASTVTVKGLIYFLLDTPYVDPATVVTPPVEATASE